MSKLEQLIKEHCPNGVPYKTLGELGIFYGGLSGKSKEDFKGGNDKFITYMNVYSNPALKLDVTGTVRISEGEKQNIVQYGDVVFTGSSETPDECGISSVLTQHTSEKFYLNSFCMGYRLNDLSQFLPDFLKHLFRCSNLREQIKQTASGVTRFNVSKDKMKKVVIPIPPLPVQSEIVRILDNFTELKAELTAELTTRKIQYVFYINKILSQHTNGRKLLLKDISNTFRGKYITKKSAKAGNIPVILGGQEPAYYIDDYNREGEIVVVARSGASAGFVSYWNERIFVTDGFGYEAKKDIVTTKYLYYILKNIEPKLNSMKRGAGVPHVSGEVLSNLEFLIPHIEEQKRIVAILDHFDTICNDIAEGLPAEIEARTKQYEYYRDKILTFKEKVN